MSSGDDGAGAPSPQRRAGTAHHRGLSGIGTYPGETAAPPVPKSAPFGIKIISEKAVGIQGQAPKSRPAGGVRTGKAESPTSPGANNGETDGEKTPTLPNRQILFHKSPARGQRHRSRAAQEPPGDSFVLRSSSSAPIFSNRSPLEENTR